MELQQAFEKVRLGVALKLKATENLKMFQRNTSFKSETAAFDDDPFPVSSSELNLPDIIEEPEKEQEAQLEES